MIADWLLKLLGEDPAVYPHPDDKWPAIAAVAIDYAVPIIMIAVFLFPLLILKLRRRKFTALNVIIAIIIGALLAAFIWWLNEWSYGYGQAVIFRQIYE